jgi:hypothetical protein
MPLEEVGPIGSGKPRQLSPSDIFKRDRPFLPTLLMGLMVVRLSNAPNEPHGEAASLLTSRRVGSILVVGQHL